MQAQHIGETACSIFHSQGNRLIQLRNVRTEGEFAIGTHTVLVNGHIDYRLNFAGYILRTLQVFFNNGILSPIQRCVYHLDRCIVYSGCCRDRRVRGKTGIYIVVFLFAHDAQGTAGEHVAGAAHIAKDARGPQLAYSVSFFYGTICAQFHG